MKTAEEIVAHDKQRADEDIARQMAAWKRAHKPWPRSQAQPARCCCGGLVRALALRIKRRIQQACLLALQTRGDRHADRAYRRLSQAERPNVGDQRRAEAP